MPNVFAGCISWLLFRNLDGEIAKKCFFFIFLLFKVLISILIIIMCMIKMLCFLINFWCWLYKTCQVNVECSSTRENIENICMLFGIYSDLHYKRYWQLPITIQTLPNETCQWRGNRYFRFIFNLCKDLVFCNF